MSEDGKELALPRDGGAAALVATPFEVGRAPFRIKGNAYRGHLDYVSNEIPGGLDAQAEMLKRLHPERGELWARFMDQTFLASAWYDVYPIAIAGVACARIVGLPFLEFVHRRVCVQAQGDIKGIHRFLLKLISAKSIAVRIPIMSAQYFDFVEIEHVKADKEAVVARVSGIPFALAPWWTTLADAYIGTASEIAGGRRPLISAGPYLDAGDAQGVRMCTVHSQVTWQDGPAPEEES